MKTDDPALADWFRSYRAKQARRLAYDLGYARESTPSGGRVVDLGAVPPILSAALVSLGYEVRAVDIAPERFRTAFASMSVEPIRCDLEVDPIPIEDAWADTVVLHEVLEHMRIDPVHAVGEASRILRPGGSLLVSTPNLMSLQGVLNLLLRGRAETVGADPWKEYRKLREIGHMGHVREYTTVEVCDFLRHFGLEPETLVFRGRARGRVRGPLVRSVAPLRPFFEVIARRVS